MVPCVVLLCMVLGLAASATVNSRDEDSAGSVYHKDILMRQAKPSQPDAYLCTGYDVEESETYVVKFEALANADTAHHILMYGCEDQAASSDDIWNCPPVCRGRQQIMFAWAKNAPPTQLPDGVGLRIGKMTSIKKIVMQIHYAKSFKEDEPPDSSGIRLHLSKKKQQYVAGVFLLMSYNFIVPPNQEKYHVDISCQFKKGYSMFPFAYRTHAHGLGSVITGYQYNDTGYHLIGKGNPQWPQAFYPSNASIEVKPGDKLVARCTYNSVGMDHTVKVGATGRDEMCNFYIMFYTDTSVEEPSGQCGGSDFGDLVSNLPADSDVTLPPQPLLEAEAHGHHHHHHPMGSSASATVSSGGEDTAGTIYLKDILMRQAKPSQPDAYLCTGYDVEEDETYVVKFEALANADTAHHILMYGCEDQAASSDDIWNCPPICQGRKQIMFAWAKNAPPTQLPDGVGLRIGKKTSIKKIVMQIHYAKSFKEDENPDSSGIRLHLSKKKQQYVAGVFILFSSNFVVPPNQEKYHVDISCEFKEKYSIFPFAYRTHAHGLGSVITGYQHNDTGYHLIGKGNPQWPQAFYPSNASIEVKPGDKLVARCTYNSVGMDHTVKVGATGSDEMCNFYIMFYTDASVVEPSGKCGWSEFEDLVNNLPADSDVTLPPQPLLEAEAHGHHHHHHPMGSSGVHTSVHNPTESLSGGLQYLSDWPGDQVKIGQVGGVATDSVGNVYIFHRGDRVWDHSSFDMNNNFQLKDQPIQQNTVLILSPEGHLVRKFGANRHFMPHGIEVDQQGNVWLTDVALHQVFRIPAGGTEANLILGERFVHGDDDDHFCKPTDVAVLKSGEFFVSDGYCNSRILKFSKDGRLLKQWGQRNSLGGGEAGPAQFMVPHSLTVAPGLGLLCVADRENGRIQCFDLDGQFRFFIKHPQFGRAVYAVEYSPRHGGVLYAVNGGASEVKGFTFSLHSHTLLESWNLPSPQSLSTPHDVAVDGMSDAVYVGELKPPGVRKFLRHLTTDTTSDTARTPAQHTGAESAVQPILQRIGQEEGAGQGEGESSPAGDGAQSDEVTLKKEGRTSLTPMVLVGALVAVPVLVVMVFVIVWHQRGRGCCSSQAGRLKNPYKGFDPLLQNFTDDSDSENEMFLQPTKEKTQPGPLK
ncbi:peptidyl-glycine alpha-amidating monooxygenase B-like [Babylonia areolata]|uniref:peptidyl-glycine alpha-amidating monooxygenase B-like n=1 Tax=Babylonia areolata TaxID=304850 RepID=UPI003FD504D8